MPGYYIHLAACPVDTLKNRSFVLGVEAPDLLKKYYKICCGSEKAGAKFNVIRTNMTPEYNQLKKRVEQKESAKSNEGLHYGLSSNPDVRACWDDLDPVKKANPFYRGYVWHLLTDKLIYSKLNIDEKFHNVLEKKEHVDIDELRKEEVKKLHSDWDKTNALVRDTYPEVALTDEVKELGVVQFASGELVYVSWEVLKDTIEYLRSFNPINGDMDFIIEEVLNNIKN